MRKALHRLTSFFLSVGLLTMGVPVRAQVDGYADARAELSAGMAEVAGIRGLLDRAAFDLDELAMELFFEDAEGIAAWVTDNVAYQPYRGLLRGAQGTLRARAGNALDQAVLLASLLGQAGYDVRVALGTLDDAQAAELLGTTAAAPARDYGELESRLRAALPSMDWDLFFAAQPDADRSAETAELAGALGAALADAGVQLASAGPDLLAEAAEYAWVEYRLGDGEAWAAAHPAAPFVAGAEPEVAERLEGGVPEALQHRVRFEVLVEVLEGDELTVRPVMPAWERPAANADGVVISYSNVPNTAAMEADLPTVLAESEFWVPTFMGGVPEGAQAFDMMGALLTPEDAANPMAGVVRNVRRGFSDAIGGLGGMGGEPTGEAVALTAQWLVVTLVAPGGEEREFRRTVFDRIGAEAREAGAVTTAAMTREEAELRLLTEHRLMIFPGATPRDFLLDEYLEQVLASEPLLERALALRYGVEPERGLAESLAQGSPVEHLLTMALFDQGPAGQLSWRAEPGLLMFSDGLAGSVEEARIVSRLDIVNNSRRTLGAGGPASMLAQGVWETLTERDLLGDRRHNTANFRGDLTVVEPFGAAPAGLSAEARRNLQRDLDLGYAALVPAGADAWWRVDPTTGETLGITADGRGQSLTEYTIMLYDNAFTLMFAMKSYNDCTKGNPSWEAELCCLAKAHISNIFGIGLGHAIGGFGFGGAVLGMAALSFNITSGLLGTNFADLFPGGVC